MEFSYRDFKEIYLCQNDKKSKKQKWSFKNNHHNKFLFTSKHGVCEFGPLSSADFFVYVGKKKISPQALSLP